MTGVGDHLTVTLNLGDGPATVYAHRVVEPEVLTCEFEDPATGRECGADGVIFHVHLWNGNIATDDTDVKVCPEHVGPSCGGRLRDDGLPGEPSYMVMLVQEPA